MFKKHKKKPPVSKTKLNLSKMKFKTIILLALFAVMSCKTKQEVKSTPPFSLSDNWLLKTVAYQDPNLFDTIVLFNDATNQCFKDSIWEFKPTSNSGSYSINDLNCSFGYRNLWFKFLKTDQQTGITHITLRAENKSGMIKNHNIKITKQSTTAMQWSYSISVKGKRRTVNMLFEKV
ncbi:hypothetical protein CXF54_00845 [Olleya sp. 1-3]|nr:hypothetical protein CXF54_00845 [Olleya sp. 1-3]